MKRYNFLGFVDQNVRALVVTTVFLVVLRFSSNLILARLLEPRDFAIAGLLGSVFYTLALMSETGIEVFLIRYKGKLSQSLIDTCWTLSLIRGLFLCLILIVFAGEISTWLNTPVLDQVLIVCAAVFIFDGLRSMSLVVAQRENNAAKPLYINTSSETVSKFGMLGAATVFPSYWVFVLAKYIEAIANFVASYRLFPSRWPRLSIDSRYLSEIGQLMLVLLPSSILTIAIMQADKFVLANTMSMGQLGLYFIAVSIAMIPHHFLMQYARKIVLPFCSELNRSHSLLEFKNRYYQKTNHLMMLSSFAIGVGAATAHPVIEWIYPPNYHAAATFLTLLLCNYIFACVTFTSEQSLLGLGNSQIPLRANLLRLLWIVVTAPVLYFSVGSIGIIISFSTREILPCLFLLRRKSSLGILSVRSELLILSMGLLGWVLPSIWV